MRLNNNSYQNLKPISKKEGTEMVDVAELKQKAFMWLDARKQETIDLCSNLIKIPTENPPIAYMKEIMDYMGGIIAGCGLVPQTHDIGDGRIVLFSEMKGTDSSPCLLLNGHADVVPAGDPEKWSFDPFSGEVRNGKILGRGTSDMKSGLAGLLQAFLAIHDVVLPEVELPGRLVFSSVPDEETGGQGSQWLAEPGRIDPTSVVFGEPGNAKIIDVGEKGVCWLMFSAIGEPAHGSRPMLGTNAITMMQETTQLIRDAFDMRYVETPAELLETVTGGKEVLAQETADGGFPEKAEEVKKLLDCVSVNVGVINGGTKINVVPESCTLQVDMRLPFGITADDVRKEVGDLLTRAELHDVTFSQPSFTNPSFTLSTSKIVKVLQTNVQTVLGIPAQLKISTGGTDAPSFRKREIPAVSFGPGSTLAAHIQDESVSVQELLDATKVYVGMILDFFFS